MAYEIETAGSGKAAFGKEGHWACGHLTVYCGFRLYWGVGPLDIRCVCYDKI